MKLTQKAVGGAVFCALLLSGMVGGILLEDQLVSQTERRKMAQFPSFSWSDVAGYSTSLETYLLEQFPARDLFRGIKTQFDTVVLGKTDANGYVEQDGHLFQIQTTYDQTQVTQAGELFANIADRYFADANLYYAVIPDKNYFVDDLLSYDYDATLQLLGQAMPDATDIAIADCLQLDDYYSTDLHAKQEGLLPLAQTLLSAMGTTARLSYAQTLATDQFYGGYHAASGYWSAPDDLYYLNNDMLQQAIVYDYEAGDTVEMYQLDKLNSMDDYDLFLGGARALLTIENPSVDNGKHLILFRDSFGSSVAPLLLEGYEQVTLVDLRYVSASYAMTLLQQDQDVVYDDVLFLYQVQLLHNSNSFKIDY